MIVDGARWQRMWDVFHDAVNRHLSEQAQFVDVMLADDPELATEVRALLDSHQSAGSFLDEPAIALDALLHQDRKMDGEHLIGRKIGSFTILELIGRGGMGVVFRAQQHKPSRQVALKLIRGGLLDARAIRRFEFEAEMLARLQHPNIAQLFEAGTFCDIGSIHQESQPYLALELVQGLPITEYARQHSLSIPAILKLMIDVCEAVHHAHSRGVVHRDLKPGNILIDLWSDKPRPKILDFGVARMVQEHPDVAPATIVAEVAGTIAYMCPEQLCGKAGDQAGVAGDVYSLGVLCFQLLANRLPHEFESRSLLDAIAVVRTQQPRRLGETMPALRGDLETIVHKAMEQEPQRRYDSAAELAADLRRFLDRRPIAARTATRGYRLKRFAQRRPAVVSGIAATAMTLLVGISATIWQAGEARDAERRAITRLQQVQRLASTIVDELAATIAKLPQTAELRSTLIQQAVQALEALRADDLDDPQFLLQLARSHHALGRTIGDTRTSSLGDPGAALEQQRRAAQLIDQAEQRGGDWTEITTIRAQVLATIADLLTWTGDLDAGAAAYAQSARQFAALARSGDMESLELCLSRYRIANGYLYEAKRLDEVELNIAAAAEALTSVALPANPSDEQYLLLANIQAEMCRVYHSNNHVEKALEHAAEAEGLYLRAAEVHSDALAVQTSHAYMLTNIALIFEETGRLEQALETANRAAKLFEMALPHDPNLPPMLGRSLAHVARVADKLGRIDDAIAASRKSVERLQAWGRSEPDSPSHRYWVYGGWQWHGDRLMSILEHHPLSEQQRMQLIGEARDVQHQLAELLQSSRADGDPGAWTPEQAQQQTDALAQLAVRIDRAVESIHSHDTVE